MWIESDGSVHLSPGVAPTLRETGALLGILYAEMRSRGMRLPAGLVLLSARATGQLEGASLPTPEEFYASLARFEPPDPRATLQSLFASAAGALGSPDTAPSAVAEGSLAADVPRSDVTLTMTSYSMTTRWPMNSCATSIRCCSHMMHGMRPGIRVCARLPSRCSSFVPAPRRQSFSTRRTLQPAA